jgi:hypothetical protein
MSETKWIDWHPRVGDVRPEVYRCRKCLDGCWRNGTAGGKKLSNWSHENYYYQIPAPKDETMKYWQPRIEPTQKGWTLADVPEDVVCEIKKPVGTTYFASMTGDKVFDHTTGVSLHIKPSECRVIRVIDPLPAGVMTLDKVPEGVRCVCQEGKSDCIVRVRAAHYACSVSGQGFFNARDYQVLFILDPLPELSVTLDTLPVGRVITVPSFPKTRWFKTQLGGWWEWSYGGWIGQCNVVPEFNKFEVTDYLMELKEVAT